MFRLFHVLAFIVCVVWFLVEGGLEPIYAIFLTTASFFKDEVKGIIGKNFFSLSPREKPIKNLESIRYSFFNENYINPRIVNKFNCWISDTEDTTVAYNLIKKEADNEMNKSDFKTKKIINDYPIIYYEEKNDFNQVESFSYQYIGTSLSGIHIIRTAECGGGSGVFCQIMLFTLTEDYRFCEQGNKKRLNLKSIGTIPLGDRYDGKITYKWGRLLLEAPSRSDTPRKKRTSFWVI